MKYRIPKNKVKLNDDDHFGLVLVATIWSVICFGAGTWVAAMIMGF